MGHVPLPAARFLPAILKMSDLLAYTKLSRATIRRLVDSGEFPPPIQLSASTAKGSAARGWRRSDVDEWVASRPTFNAT